MGLLSDPFATCGILAAIVDRPQGVDIRAKGPFQALRLGYIPVVVDADQNRQIRVFLLDDHELVRRGIKDMLYTEADITVVGEASNGDEALEKIPMTRPEVAVLDVRLGDGITGVEVCREIRSAHPEVSCVMLTSFADDEALFASIMAGASGYVLKQIRGVDLVQAIRRVAGGESLLDSAVTARVLERLRNPPEDEDPLRDLSPQERRILDLIAEGHTNREIADTMFLAEKTVKNYVSHLLAKLGMARRSEAAAYAARLEERRRRPLSGDA